MQLTIDKIKPTAKSIVVTAGGKEYFAKKDSGITAGITIEAETEDSEYNGKNYCWIKKWKAMAAQPPAQPPAQQKNAPIATNGTAPWWMPFVSNITAHAIQAGLITEPRQVEGWATAARNAAHKLETDIPF